MLSPSEWYCLKMGSDLNPFNVSLMVRGKDKRQCPQTTTFKDKGEQEWTQTNVSLLTSLALCRSTKPAPQSRTRSHGNSQLIENGGRSMRGVGWGRGEMRQPRERSVMTV